MVSHPSPLQIKEIIDNTDGVYSTTYDKDSNLIVIKFKNINHIPQVLKYCEKLRQVTIKYSDITGIETGFSYVTHINSLHIYNSRIKINQYLPKFEHFRLFIVSRTDHDIELNRGFSLNKKLRSITFSFCDLEYLPMLNFDYQYKLKKDQPQLRIIESGIDKEKLKKSMLRYRIAANRSKLIVSNWKIIIRLFGSQIPFLEEYNTKPAIYSDKRVEYQFYLNQVINTILKESSNPSV